MDILILYLESVSLFSNSGYRWTIAVLLFVGTTILIKLFKLGVVSRLRHLAEKTETDLDDAIVEMVENIGALFYSVTSLYVAIKWLSVPIWLDTGADLVFIIVVVYESIKAITGLIQNFAHHFLNDAKKTTPEKEQHNKTLISMLRITVRVFLWLVGLTIILSYLGVNITSIVASLGIGGIAVALAVQNILGDIFSSFSIYMDKPFEIGDYVVVGNNEGTVEKIGLKSTRLRALTGEELVISNKELTTTRVQNFKRMKKRRVAFTLGVTYETSHSKLKAIPKIIKEEVKKVSDTQWENCYFKRYGSSSLDHDVIFFIKSGDFNQYMKTMEKVNLAIFKRFEEENIAFAYPTQTIHLAK